MADLLSQIGGIVAYSTSGHKGIAGQVIGANGSGNFCVVLLGTPEQADAASAALRRELEAKGHTIEQWVFVPNDEDGAYFGNPLSVREAGNG